MVCKWEVVGLQVEGLDKKPHIVVATPGRLLDLVDEQQLSLGMFLFFPPWQGHVRHTLAQISLLEGSLPRRLHKILPSKLCSGN